MQLYPSEDETSLITTAQQLIDTASPVTAGAFKTEKLVVNRATWQRYAELGWFDADLPETPGFRHTQLFLQQRAGHSLLRGPIMATVVGAALMKRSGLITEYESVRDGNARIGLAEQTKPRPGESSAYCYTAWDIEDIDYYLIVSPQESVLVAAAGTERQPIPSVEQGRGIASMRVAMDTVLARETGSRGFLETALLVTAELCGVLQAVTEMSAHYAVERQQFGVPIGMFQAVKHRCAEMAVRFESAWALCCLAAVQYSDRAEDATAHVYAAKLLAGDYGLASCKDNVQNHGGIGFTAECNAHHFFKRALLLGRTVGDRYDSMSALAAEGFGLARMQH